MKRSSKNHWIGNNSTELRETMPSRPLDPLSLEPIRTIPRMGSGQVEKEEYSPRLL